MRVTRSHLRVFSTVCSNLVVIWLAASLTAREASLLLRNLFLVVVFWYLAVNADSLAEQDEH